MDKSIDASGLEVRMNLPEKLTVKADGGSGLGLSIVQSFVAAQGGTFTVSIDGDLFKASIRLPLVSDIV